MKIRLVALAAILLPATALAQPVPEPVDPDQPHAPAPVVEPAPTVIVNPPPPPTVYTTEPEYETYTDTWNAPVFTSGALVFLGAYGASVIVAANSEGDAIDRGNDRLYVPVVGPWLALNDRPDCPVEQEACDGETTKKVLLVADGILQAGGVITMISGLLSPTEHRVLRRPGTVSTKVRVTPTASTGGPGLSVFGRF